MIQQIVLLTSSEAAALDRIAAAWGQDRDFVIRAAIGRLLFSDDDPWQPIATAPKDGTPILVGRLNDNVGVDAIEISNWCVMEQSHYEEVEGGLFRKVIDPPYEFWNNNGHLATHWMPLPLPPRSTEAPKPKVVQEVVPV